MITEFGNDLKKVLLAGIGAVAITADKSEEVVRELVKRGELTVEQGKALNEELKHKIKETVQEKRAAFRKAVDPFDVEAMSKEEREELKRKLEEFDAKEQHDTESTKE